MDLWRLEMEMDYLEGVRQYEALRRANRRATFISVAIVAAVVACATAAAWWALPL